MSTPRGEPQAPLDLLTDLRRARASDSSAHLRDTLVAWDLRPLAGGRNHDVYARTDPAGTATCIKVFTKVDDRRRADREWAALTLLAEHGAAGVPVPLWLDQAGPNNIIGMTLLDGVPLLAADDVPAAVAGMADTVRRLQAVPMSGWLANVDRVDSCAHYGLRLTGRWPAQLAANPDDPLTPELLRLLATWRAGGDLACATGPAPQVFSRGDGNLLNWLRHGPVSACVDFECSGGSTIAFDAADQIEHISARDVPDAVWFDLLPDLGVTGGNRAQFGAAQRTCALRWLAVLWRQRHQRAAEFDRQLTRVHMLHDPASPWRT